LRCIGRSGTQVKLHGQRVELEEVENHFEGAKDVVAEVAASPLGQNGAPRLVAFVLLDARGENVGEGELFLPPSDSFKIAVAKAVKTLKVLVYMVPAAFISLKYIPRIGIGKTDRRKLRKLANTDSFTSSSSRKRLPSTPVEQTLQDIWSRALSTELEGIGIGDNFIGGDSIVASKLVSLAREVGLNITAADLFKNPKSLSWLLSANRHMRKTLSLWSISQFRF
jgi:hypothetical protein